MKGPEVILECVYCGNMKVHTIDIDWFPDVPPLDIENWTKAKKIGIKVSHEDRTPIEDGEVIPAICLRCGRRGMPESILVKEAECL